MRKLAKRVRKLFADRKTWVRLIVVTAIASGVAWKLGDVLLKNGWDEKPIMKTLGGKETEVFTLSALAHALEKSLVTIRLWERKGYIPRAPYRLRAKTLQGKKTGGNRVYTRSLIEATVEEFAKRGLLGTARVEWNQHEDLTEALIKRWKEVTSTESR